MIRTFTDPALDMPEYHLGNPFDEWSDDLRPALHQVARDFQTQIDAVADAATETIGREIAEYRAGQPDSMLGEVEGIVRVGLQLFTKILLEERMPITEELTFLTELASVRATQGLSMVSVLHAYRIGHRLTWEAVLRMTESHPDSDRLGVALSRPVMSFIEVLTINVASVYLHASRFSEADRDAETRTLVDTVLRGEWPEPMSDLSREAMRKLTGENGFVVLRGKVHNRDSVATPSIRRIAAAVGQLGVAGGRTAIVIPYEQGLVGFLEVGRGGAEPVCEYLAQSHQAIETEAGGPVRLGVGLQCLRVEDAPRGLREAEEALRMTREERPVLALPLTPIFVHLLGRANRTLGHVASDRMREFADADRRVSGELGRTVFAYADANQNSRVAAENLHCHVNTVKNRIRRIHELTGLDPNNFRDLVDLVAAQELMLGWTG